jgi:predicted 3-demethylubiquinone-9 3-methyltransferase (glyoxalase superfamily)
MARIRPFLWFDGQAEDAMTFYASLFPNSRIMDVSRGPKGAVMSVTCELDGLEIMAFNAGPQFKFNEAISFFVSCETQDEVDRLWLKLTDGGEESQCGWLKDRYGLWWQIIPTALGELMGDPDLAKAGRVREAMLDMRKIDIAGLKRAYEES